MFAKHPKWHNFNDEAFRSQEAMELSECQPRQGIPQSDIMEAFTCLEQYALNLIKYQWKDELKTIRVCQGMEDSRNI